MHTFSFNQRNTKKVKLLLIPFAIYVLGLIWFISFGPYSDAIITWVNQFTGSSKILGFLFAVPVFIPLFYVLSKMKQTVFLSFYNDKCTIAIAKKEPIDIHYAQISSMKLNYPLPNQLVLLTADQKTLYTFRPMKNDLPLHQIIDQLSQFINFKVEILKPVKFFKVTFVSKSFTRIQ